MITVQVFDKPEEISRLINYKDHDVEAVLDVDYGGFIQWLQQVIPGNPCFRLFAATEKDKVIGFCVGVLCITKPVFSYVTAIHFTSQKTEASLLLKKEYEAWGKANGASRSHIETTREKAARLYERKAGYQRIGWILSKEL